MDKEQMLQRAVDSKLTPVYMNTYNQIKDYYQDTHGQRGWVGAMAQALTGSSTKSGKEYKAARRSIERFETGQNKSMKKYGAKMPSVGRSLPAIGKRLAGNAITITVHGSQDGKQHKGTRNRKIEVTFTGARAQEFADSPTWDDLWDEYGADLGDDSDYAIDVESVA